MKTILLLLAIASTAHAQWVLRSEFKMVDVPAVTSPFVIELDVDAELYAFDCEGATSKERDGNKCTFEAAPGLRMVTTYGLIWAEKDGRTILRPTHAGKRYVLVVESLPSDPTSADAEFSTIAKPAPKPKAAPKPKEPEPEPNPFDGVRIQIALNPEIQCPPCERWKKEMWPVFEKMGVQVEPVSLPGVSPVPQFRVTKNNRATKWDSKWLDKAHLQRHLDALER